MALAPLGCGLAVPGNSLRPSPTDKRGFVEAQVSSTEIPATFVRAKITSLDTLERVVLFSRQVVSDSFAVLWTVAHQAPLSMEFPSQEYCSGLSPPSPGDLPDSGIEPVSSALQELI